MQKWIVNKQINVISSNTAVVIKSLLWSSY